MDQMRNVSHIQAQTERVGEDALHWVAMMNLQLIAPLLMTTIRSLSLLNTLNYTYLDIVARSLFFVINFIGIKHVE